MMNAANQLTTPRPGLTQQGNMRPIQNVSTRYIKRLPNCISQTSVSVTPARRFSWQARFRVRKLELQPQKRVSESSFHCLLSTLTFETIQGC